MKITGVKRNFLSFLNCNIREGNSKHTSDSLHDDKETYCPVQVISHLKHN